MNPKAKKQLQKLDFNLCQRIAKLFDTLQTIGNPRNKGKPLVANLAGFWRYRVGDWRIICEIVDSSNCIYVIDIRHRSEVYK
ncbi:type II toxin-antitoxin system RelE/ParE family toxin [uncultured Helicobacter sp.]|uniref:type II toxin-antitoxin system RelE family toxin n=1 Tax=uncultured Helicobacter sp. TaxID=175537 RepID=UPI0027DE0E85|nr:type II toxin-antitoxin system RelE/ParE family toxin [uncultured Helicobacter sp.]